MFGPNKFNRLSAFFVVTLLFFSIHLFSGQSEDGFKIIKSDTRQLIIEYTPVFNGYSEIETESGSEAWLPEFEGAYLDKGRSGEYARIYISRMIAVPPSGFELENINSEWISFPKQMAPNPKLVKEDGLPTEVYEFSNEPGRNYSAPEISLRHTGISRNINIAELKIPVAFYDSEKGALRKLLKARITIEFNYYTGSAAVSDNMAASFALNSNAARDWGIADKSQKSSLPSTMKVKPEILNLQNWVRIGVENEGIYRIDAGALSSIGVNIPASEINTIKIFGNGGKELSENVSDALDNSMNEQAIIVREKSGGGLDEIIFYGAPGYGFEYTGSEFVHYLNHYSPAKKSEEKRNFEKNYYLLTWGGAEGKRAEGIANPADNPSEKPATYVHRIFYEKELYNASVSGAGRHWFGNNIMPAQFTEVLHNLDRSGVINYRFSVAQRAEADGEFTIYDNGQEITGISVGRVFGSSYEDAYRAEGSGSMPASKIAGDNRSLLEFVYDNPLGSSATGFFDWYEIHYPRSFVPINNEIGFFTDPDTEGICEFGINGFSGQEIIGFDISDIKDPKLLTNMSSTGGMFIFKTELETNQPKKFFLASKLRSPELEKTTIANLRSEFANTDMIVITHPDLTGSAEKYKKYREENSDLNISLVTTEHIYNEFGSGLPDPTAIRDFLAYAYENWDTKPRYVLLWGDGHYDYKNISTNSVCFVPPYESIQWTKIIDGIDSYTTDDYYARIVGDDRLIDLAIGRLTIDSDEVGEWMVDKIEHYEHNSSTDLWRSCITLLADDSYKRSSSGDGNGHTSDSENLSRVYVPVFMQQKKFYLPEYPNENVPGGIRKPGCEADLLSSINQSGTILINWYGHGNPRVWAHEEILERSTTIPKMLNLDKLFFLSAATCDFGRFDMTDLRSGAEELVLSDKGGAIGVFSASRVVFASSNHRINKKFYSELFERSGQTGRYRRVGDVMFDVKQEMTGPNDEKFFLLGDPTLRLLLPHYRSRIDSINHIYVADNSDTLTLKGLSEVTVSGSVLFGDTDAVDDTFNGTAVLTMLDGDEYVEVEDYYDASTHYILRHGGALNISSYEVVDGHFTAKFIIPKDISYSDNLGRMYAYAYTDDNRFATGATRCYKVQGIDVSDNPDSEGPEISIFLDSRQFEAGDIVSAEPLLIVDLSDESGINSTGRGIGHRIEAWIDDDPESVDLTESFSTSIENPRAGTAEKRLEKLDPGAHTVKVRAWDVFNNYSEEETYFNIASDGDIVIVRVYSYPNPFENSTTIAFEHNATPPFDAEIKVYSVNGSLVRSLEGTFSTNHTAEILWNGLDRDSQGIAQGTYIVKVKITDQNGATETKSGLVSLLKK